jgi:hypothetical protein
MALQFATICLVYHSSASIPCPVKTDNPPIRSLAEEFFGRVLYCFVQRWQAGCAAGGKAQWYPLEEEGMVVEAGSDSWIDRGYSKRWLLAILIYLASPRVNITQTYRPMSPAVKDIAAPTAPGGREARSRVYPMDVNDLIRSNVRAQRCAAGLIRSFSDVGQSLILRAVLFQFQGSQYSRFLSFIAVPGPTGITTACLQLAKTLWPTPLRPRLAISIV